MAFCWTVVVSAAHDVHTTVKLLSAQMLATLLHGYKRPYPTGVGHIPHE